MFSLKQPAEAVGSGGERNILNGRDLLKRQKVLTLKDLDENRWFPKECWCAVLEFPLPKKPSYQLVREATRYLLMGLDLEIFDPDDAGVNPCCDFIDVVCAKLKELSRAYPGARWRYCHDPKLSPEEKQERIDETSAFEQR